MLEAPRLDPDALAADLAKASAGKLKIFLGSAPGVGKTWEMLVAARRRIIEGADVLAGIIETHGRQDTEAQLGVIPVMPRRTLAYRGQALQEFDLDAALARKPGLLLMDELAHTNAPGSRHGKRWEDVADLLAAGIDVWATLNVQHLESLNDSVARITGVRVTETLPDHVLALANEIELIDLPPGELQQRLREGRIYRPDVAKRALAGFFREGNLASLREMALRRTAQHVDDDVRGYMQRHAIEGPWPAGERVMALVAADGSGEAVVRFAKRLAEALRAPWIVLHVERPVADPLAIRPCLALAAQLGAEIVTRSADDLVDATIAVGRERNVTQLVIGRTARRTWRSRLRRRLGSQLMRRAPDFALLVVPNSGRIPAPPPIRVPEGLVGWGGTTALVAAVAGLGTLVRVQVPQEAMGMVFLATVVAAGSRWGLRIALYAAALAFLAWDFLFIPPLYALTIGRAQDLIALAVFVAVALIVGVLASRVRTEAHFGQARIDALRRIGAFSRKLGVPTTEPELLEEIARQAAGVAGRAIVLTGADDAFDIRAAQPAADTMDEGAWAAARWTFAHQEAAGRGTSTLPSASWRFMPMRTVRGLLGVLGVRTEASFDPSLVQVLEALADQAAVALERVRLANQSARSAAQEETQKLRTALLNSLSHDLRTPLTGIRGAADTLRDAWDTLTPATRRDLLASIGEDTGRMTKFLANIMDLTRLESGQIAPRLSVAAVADIVEAAIARVPAASHVTVALPQPPPSALVDPALLEQALVNVLDNAVRYSPAGGMIAVRVTVAGGFVRIAVADEGTGISAADLPHVFDSFYRASRGDRVPPGTGLGLAIARGLVEAVGGTVEASSPRPDAPADGAPGTIVSLRVPVAR